MKDRRDFLRTLALAAAPLPWLSSAVFTSERGQGTSPRWTGPTVPAGRAKRLLILGGTGFIGPHSVQAALDRGHEVTMFNRGRTNAHLFPDVEKLVGDRSDDLEALRGRRWDVVIDNHATLPRWVRQSAQLLKDAADQYIHVSTISVYAPAAYPDGAAAGSPEEDRARLAEDAPLAELPSGHDGSEDVTGQTYGPFKWMAEDEARRAFGEDRTTIVRPGLIVGPGDPTDRFTYWPARLQRGGDVLAPGSGMDSAQFIDARDLTSWIVTLAEQGMAGTFNATGPAERLSMRAFLEDAREALGSEAVLHWLPADFLSEQGVGAWGDMPVWIPGNPLTYVRIDRALAAGLTFRPLGETVRDTAEWNATRAVTELRAGITAEREAEVLRAWEGQQSNRP